MDAEKTPTKPRPSITRWQQLRGVLHRVLELLRKPPHLTTAAALLGVTVLMVLVWVHAAAYTRDSPQNSTATLRPISCMIFLPGTGVWVPGACFQPWFLRLYGCADAC